MKKQDDAVIERRSETPFDLHEATIDELHQAIQSSRVRLTLRGHSDARGVAFSPNGKRLVTAGGFGTWTVWDAIGGQELLTHLGGGHSGTVEGVSFSPDGERLASASFDKTAKVWDAGNGRELLTLRGFESASPWARGVKFSPDGRRLAFAGMGMGSKVWDATLLTEESCRQL